MKGVFFTVDFTIKRLGGNCCFYKQNPHGMFQIVNYVWAAWAKHITSEHKMRLFWAQLVAQTHVERYRVGRRKCCLTQNVPVSSGTSVMIEDALDLLIFEFFLCIIVLFDATDLKEYQADKNRQAYWETSPSGLMLILCKQWNFVSLPCFLSCNVFLFVSLQLPCIHIF